MAEIKEISYICDNCGKKLKTCDNHLNIMTSKSESSYYWKRIHVLIKTRTGYDNNGEERNSDLCVICAIQLLNNALIRVKGGERATAGTEKIGQCFWV